jgi:hypothetical protein
MADEQQTPEELAEQRKQAALAAREAHNQSRLERLNAIADNNDVHGAADMQDTDGNKLVMNEETTPEEREAAAAQEDLDVQRFLAEQEAKALQEQGAAGAETTGEETRAEASPDLKVVNGVTHYLTIVNGKEKWLTLSQLRASAQKVESADEYLASAAASVRHAAALALQEPETDDARAELIATLNSAVMGDEEAIERIADRLNERPSVTPELVQQLTDRQSFEREAAWFQREFSDVWSDPRLKRLAVERDSELAQQQPSMPYRDRLQAVGNELRGWFASHMGVRAASSRTKLDRKRSLVNVPTAAARQTPTEDEEAEESVEEAIQKMARARGQNRAFVHGRQNS